MTENLEKFLKSRNLIVVRKKNKNGSFMAGKDSTFVIPPLNANPTIKSILPEYSIEKAKKFMDVSLPENYNLFEDPKYKDVITPVLNQQHCGSCWAFSTSCAASDSYVVSGLLKRSPLISPTSIMTQSFDRNYGNGCAGGQPSTVALFFSEPDGPQMYSEYCIDYNWCIQNPKCSGAGMEHLSLPQIDYEKLNKILPKSYCISDKRNKLGYRIKENSVSQTINTDIIKAHILKVGSVVGAFGVYDSIKTYQKNNVNEGVYIENIDSTTGEFIKSKDNTLLGYHAVRIVGWGISKSKIKYDPNKDEKRIPYWIIANSWGEEWGENGLIKYAMYPYNNASALDNPNNNLGGFVLFEVEQPSKLKDEYYLDKNYTPTQYYQDNLNKFQVSDQQEQTEPIRKWLNLNKNDVDDKSNKKNIGKIIMWIILVILMVSIIFGIYMYYK